QSRPGPGLNEHVHRPATVAGLRTAGHPRRIYRPVYVSDLGKVLEDSRPAIQAALAAARKELAALDERKRELQTLIARAQAALGEIELHVPDDEPVPLKLHEAMVHVLKAQPDGSMSAHELAREINARQLDAKPDRSPVEPD